MVARDENKLFQNVSCSERCRWPLVGRYGDELFLKTVLETKNSSELSKHSALEKVHKHDKITDIQKTNS